MKSTFSSEGIHVIEITDTMALILVAMMRILKLVSASYNGTYEECDGKSYGDPEQGFCKTYW